MRIYLVYCVSLILSERFHLIYMSEEKKQEEMKDEAVQDAPEATESTTDVAPEATEAPAEEVGEPVVDEEREAAEAEAAKQQAEEEAMTAEEVEAQELRPGMTVRVHQKINEGEKERVQVFQGIIIAMRGKTPQTKTITVRKVSFGVGVEKIYPLASPLVEKIEVVKIARVRRSKLYFLRNYRKRLKETFVK